MAFRRLIAWVRFRGWSNLYWREDWAESVCVHERPFALSFVWGSSNRTDTFTMCGSCGCLLRED